MFHRFRKPVLALTSALIALSGIAVSAAGGEPPVTATCFAADGKRAVTASQAGVVVRKWPGLQVERSLATKLSQVGDLAFSPDGKELAVAGGEPQADGTVEVFAWPAGKLLYRVRAGDDVLYRIAWRNDSTAWAAAGLDRTVELHEAETGKPLWQLTGHSRGVTAVAFLEDGRLLVSAGLDQSLRVWDSRTGELIRTLDSHTRPVNGIAVRPGGEKDALPMLASVGQDRSVRLWQPTIGRMVRFARLKSASPLAVGWSVDGRRVLVTATDGRLRIINPETARVEHELAGIDGWAYSLAVHPNGREVLVAGAQGQMQRVELPAGRDGR